jgi:hypothetical protein
MAACLTSGASLHDIVLFLQRYGEANNRLPQRGFRQAHENMLATLIRRSAS